MRTILYSITEKDSGQSIHGFLKSRGYSAAVLRLAKSGKGGVFLNGTPAFSSVRLAPGDRLTVRLDDEKPSGQLIPVCLPLSILYEDEDLLVVDKPAGMPVHPVQGNHFHTLANACAWHLRENGESPVFHCISRLDRDTTGVLVLAKHRYSASRLSAMAARREIHREYLALARGQVPVSGIIQAPIGRVPGSVIARMVRPDGAPACTRYRRLLYKNGYSLVSLCLETGRTHQIRVHMKFIGHPLPGDFLYNPDYRILRRQALHSFRLSFRHPVTGKDMEFTAPLPSDMAQAL